MKRLRHPVRAIREPFGTAGLIIACVALVFAMLGGAYAASNSGGHATASAKKGKPGPRGPKGPKGDKGETGATGPAGANGKDGTAGAPGEKGTDGTSATVSSFSGTKGTCTNGGATIKSASPEVNVCNGKDGETGFTEFLPSGKTETGAWSASTVAEEEFEPGEFRPAAFAPISFSIPLEEEVVAAKALLLAEGEENIEHCPGSAIAPEADPGYLCVYTGYGGKLQGYEEAGPIVKPSLSVGGGKGASTAGALVELDAIEPGFGISWGTWAVTAAP